MSEATILILDRNSHQKEYFLSSFKEENIPAREAENVASFSELVQNTENPFILMDYSTLVAEEREAIIQLFRTIPRKAAVVFNVPPDANRRNVFYELGALRVYDKQFTLEEVYRNLKWWMQLQKQHPAENSADIQGELQQVDFLKLLWGIAAGQQTGVLKIVTKRNIGYLFFEQGQITDAQVLNYSGLEAFLHITLWEEGTFVFRQGEFAGDRRTIAVTITGLLILAQDLKAELGTTLRDFKSEASVLQAINLGDLPLYDVEINPEFLEFLSMPRELGEILENPFYSNHQTLRLLKKLKQFGMLRVNAPIESIIQANEEFVDGVNLDQKMVSEMSGEAPKIEALKEHLRLSADQQAKIVVVGEDIELLRHFLNSLAGVPEKVLFENNMFLLRLLISDELKIILIGLPANHQLLRLLSAISERIDGFVFLINAAKAEQTEYYSYLMNQVLAQYVPPAVCAVTYLEEGQTLEAIQQKFVLSARLPWVQFKANSAQEMLETILAIRPVEPIEVKKSAQEKDEQ
jgi:hypothetical protein